MRVLFFVDRPGVLRQFSALLQELAGRGHEVRIALREQPDPDRRRAVEEIVGASPKLSYCLAPGRPARDGWLPVAWVVRALGDLARYSHPRYAAAPVLRARMTKKTLGRLRSRRLLDPFAQRLVLRLAERLAAVSDAELSDRTVRRAARLEASIPPSGEITRFIRGEAPDVVLVTSVVKPASSQVEYLKSARAAGVPAGTCVASWDNLTNKGLLKLAPERVFVWNEVQRREAVELHGIPADRVVATGAALFDPWFVREPSRPRDAFVRQAGLDPDRPYVLFLGSSPFVTRHGQVEVPFVERWIEALRAAGDERLRGIGVMVRPHPIGKAWKGVDLGRLGNVVVWPPHSERPIAEQDQGDFFDSLAHSDAVVGINTTAMIEAAIAGKSVLTVLAPGVRAGDDAALPLPAGGERRLPPGCVLARRARGPAGRRARRGRRRRRAAPAVRRVVRAAARSRPACGPGLRGRGRGARRAARRWRQRLRRPPAPRAARAGGCAARAGTARRGRMTAARARRAAGSAPAPRS